MGRWLGLDIGSRRIGVAISDPLQLTATPLKTITRSTPQADAQQIARIVEDHHVTRVVAGLPLRLNQQPSQSTTMVRSFLRVLEGELSVPLVTTSEQLSSKEAEKRMSEAGVPSTRRRDRRDEFSAAIILEWYMQEQGVEDEI